MIKSTYAPHSIHDDKMLTIHIQLAIAEYQDELNSIVEHLQQENATIKKYVGEYEKVPPEYLDPITKEIMNDPVFTADGHVRRC